jgi:soluble lytic murein transglycosylase
VVKADWRMDWTAYLEKADGTAALLRGHVERFPDSAYVPDALYWLGRLAERAGKRAEARAYYDKVATRFVETYFGRLSRERLAGLGKESDPPSIPLLQKIPPVPPARRLSYGIPAAARRQYNRALALRSIAFDNSAMLELRDAYRRTKAPGILLGAARAAQAAEHYLTGAALVRQLIPDLEARPMHSVPKNLWRIVYPLPHEALIRSNARRYRIDPMLLASLIRQESGFQPDIVSHAGAIGLAQLMPRTARKWSRKLRLRYYRRRLTNPSYNLRVGGAYFQWLTATFGSPEAALAAYNAGEDRVSSWEADRRYEEPAEFVESIPFSQTRHYVQVVMNGAVIYRRLYEGK